LATLWGEVGFRPQFGKTKETALPDPNLPNPDPDSNRPDEEISAGPLPPLGVGQPPADLALPRRIDLHCHSDASNIAGEAVLKVIGCPESYSRPQDVYAQALRRGMDFVTLTDHDSIAGALRIAQMPGVIIGEELTCWFPEDHCKIHLLVYGIEQRDHDQLQALASDIYRVAEYLEAGRIAHSVAHPIYRQNDKLERWHIERLLLLFKGFECLNGAHSRLHRDAFEPLLDGLTRQQIWHFAETHSLRPRWSEPWVKARTAGSDDHGLLNIGRTWTQFPPRTQTVQDVLDCLRRGACAPGGESGSSAKLAHTFYGVGVRYYTNQMMSPRQEPNAVTQALQTIVGQRAAPSKRKLASYLVRGKLRRMTARLRHPLTPAPAPRGASLVARAFLDSARRHFHQHPALRDALDRGLPPLGEHDEMFALISDVNRDVSAAVVAAFAEALSGSPSFTGIFDATAAAMLHQFVLLPYYFAVFHQNKERHLLRRITRIDRPLDERSLRVGLFTDTLDDVNGVGRFIRDMGAQSAKLGRGLTVHTSCAEPKPSNFDRRNFVPLLVRPLPYYNELNLTLPPLLDILEWSDRQQFDVIHCSTPGPMGLCGWMVSKMLRVPMLATYHTDFPAYVDKLTRDHRLTNATKLYMKWFYGQAHAVFSRSREYRFSLADLGVPEANVRGILPGVDTEKFNPNRRDASIWGRLGVSKPRRLLYAGRVSVEKNLPLLTRAFAELCAGRNDVALVVAGDGPYLATMRKACRGLPAHFLGYQDDRQLGALYASADLFVFPSRTDTLGQVVLEAQASGLPVLCSSEGGPKEQIADNVTGRIIWADDAGEWSKEIGALLDDELGRLRMARAAPQRIGRASLEKTFMNFWADHLRCVQPEAEPAPLAPVPA
jgi:glycosyltransferase involved in cell wall biosynthesis/predicted metal-dependent phosphoesterase TrpH